MCSHYYQWKLYCPLNGTILVGDITLIWDYFSEWYNYFCMNNGSRWTEIGWHFIDVFCHVTHDMHLVSMYPVLNLIQLSAINFFLNFYKWNKSDLILSYYCLYCVLTKFVPYIGWFCKSQGAGQIFSKLITVLNEITHFFFFW